MRLEPQQEFTLARGLEDHTDSNTYYVRAVIRNRKTDALIATVNLTDNGSRRFTKAWLAPADPTGMGLDILITYTVYTDSGYTAKSELYGERFDSFTVQHQIIHGGGGGADVDYKKVRKIIVEELAKLPTPEKPQKVNLAPILEGLDALVDEVRGIDIPTPKEVDLQPVLRAIQGVKTSVESIDIPEVPPFPETDLSPVLKELNSVRQEIKPNMAGAHKMTEAIVSHIKELSSSDFISLEDQVKALRETFDQVLQVVLQLKRATAPKKELEPVNYAELLNR